VHSSTNKETFMIAVAAHFCGLRYVLMFFLSRSHDLSAAVSMHNGTV